MRGRDLLGLSNANRQTDPVARTAYDRLSHRHERQHVLAIDSAKKAETRIRRIEKALATPWDQQPA
ncbi:YdeI/OmpD-associated family protein [Nonomuraea turkmeniaca]|nr:YdeI/OmpD-associated family protein [Nonomuraea turkmeniaca]